MNHYENMTFGRLLVTHRLPNKGKRVMWNCVCECGGTTAVSTDSLRDGKVRSCGCLKKESIAAVNFSHGACNTRAYKSWSHMKYRCTNESSAKYKSYGGRGITVCDRWIGSFENFLSDMGQPPPGCTLDRIDVNGNYEPDNCRWATAKQQGNNTRANVIVSAFGFTGTMKQVTEHFGCNYKSVHQRINVYGYSTEEAIDACKN